MEENEELNVQSLEEIATGNDVVTENAGAVTDSDSAVTENAGAVEGEASATLSKEDILEASRKENKNGDERERQGMLSANSLAMSTGLFIGGIVMLVSVLVKGKIPNEIWLIISGMESVQFIGNAVKMSKQRVINIVLSVLMCLCFIGFVVFWILELCGVVL
ncbi:MAG: DUF6442 family protein [Candidatus Coproplasma sp.]